MKIQGLTPLGIAQPVKNTQRIPSFGEHLRLQLEATNQMQLHADKAAEALMLGEIEIHDAMVIAEKANLALQLTMAIRNKIADAYQEIMRMQV